MKELTVAIGTRNPRPEYLQEVFAALASQTLDPERWDLVLVDNGSEPPVALPPEFTSKNRGRVVAEEQPGIFACRLKQLREAAAPLIVLVDDDNVLAPNYLEEALRISREFPEVGAFGGQIHPRFEIPPPEWALPLLPMLAIREFSGFAYGYSPVEDETIPCGAGMCLRREVAEAYLANESRFPGQFETLFTSVFRPSGEDSDIALHAVDIGFAKGRFSSLHLTHIIPGSRLDLDYLIQLRESMSFSKWALHHHRFPGCFPDPVPGPSLRQRILCRLFPKKEAREHGMIREAHQRGLSMLEELRIAEKSGSEGGV